MRSLGMASVLLALVFGSGSLGCGLFGIGVMDEESGDDATRGGAVEIKLDEPHDERVSADDGDHTDWKTFELPQPTRVEIHIWWDDPSVEGSLTLRGIAASAQRSLKHAKGTRHEVLGPFDLDKGKWFVEVQVTDGASVYTLELRTKGAAKSNGGGGSDLPDF